MFSGTINFNGCETGDALGGGRLSGPVGSVLTSNCSTGLGYSTSSSIQFNRTCSSNLPSYQEDSSGPWNPSS